MHSVSSSMDFSNKSAPNLTLGNTESTLRLWVPKRVIITKAASCWPLAQRVIENASALKIDVIELKTDRLPQLTGGSEAETYREAKNTLAVVISPPSQRDLQPIAPSADWQFHLARGCPAHCQYCYLAGSLPGPPITRLYANLPEILDGLKQYVGRGTVTSVSAARASEGTTFEASCYTDPLALEHLSGSLKDTISFFGKWNEDVQLRFTTKFSSPRGLLSLDHQGRTRVRFSVNAESITKRFEGGTDSLQARVSALGLFARAGYPVGLTVAPIMPILNWQEEYQNLFALVKAETDNIQDLDLTIELITHRFSAKSKSILLNWYPATKLEMDEQIRRIKMTKFGAAKYVYPKPVMTEMRSFFEELSAHQLSRARLLYWT